LLVEDNPVIQKGLREALALIEGVEITHAATTQAQATQWLDENRAGWDLAVIDIFLREGHGFEVLRKCAGRGEDRRAVVLTNYTREPVRSSAAALGADAVFDKSFELDAFIEYCASFAAGTAQPCTPL
jgi:two-component system OmpR family response regulator